MLQQQEETHTPRCLSLHAHGGVVKRGLETGLLALSPVGTSAWFGQRLGPAQLLLDLSKVKQEWEVTRIVLIVSSMLVKILNPSFSSFPIPMPPKKPPFIHLFIHPFLHPCVYSLSLFTNTYSLSTHYVPGNAILNKTVWWRRQTCAV